VSNDKLTRLREILGELPSAIIAFSGGVDSSVLLWASNDVLREHAHAVTICSPLTPPGDRETACRVAHMLGVELTVLEIDLLKTPSIARNTEDRCYQCKKVIFRKIRSVARRLGIEHVLEGSNADDLADFRPGRRASIEAGVRMPLQEAGLKKSEIRELAKQAGLETWARPSQACLASRIPFGVRLSPERLSRVATAEMVLTDMGFSGARLRDHHPVARIEVPESDLGRVLHPTIRTDLIRRIRDCGFPFVTLDLDGYRLGSLNPLQSTDVEGDV